MEFVIFAHLILQAPISLSKRIKRTSSLRGGAGVVFLLGSDYKTLKCSYIARHSPKP